MAGQAPTQAPAEQNKSAEHAVPQAPQFAGSLASSAQPEGHSACPVEQTPGSEPSSSAPSESSASLGSPEVVHADAAAPTAASVRRKLKEPRKKFLFIGSSEQCFTTWSSERRKPCGLFLPIFFRPNLGMRSSGTRSFLRFPRLVSTSDSRRENCRTEPLPGARAPSADRAARYQALPAQSKTPARTRKDPTPQC